jgi:hypothetical protein
MRPSAPPLSEAGLSEATSAMSLRSALLLVCVLGAAPMAAGCLPSQTPAAKASEAARDLNSSMRWGRTDTALEYTSPHDRNDFLERHAAWHTSQRILETELAGLYMVDATHAIVQVDVEWLLEDDTNLRNTRLEQKWVEKNGKWLLDKEERIGGAEGLFGEDVERAKPKHDTHFATKVIR